MKRRVFAAILVVFMVFAFASCRPSYIFVPVERPSTPSSSSSDGRFSDGSGTASDPFIISSESQFNCIADYSDDMKNGYYLYFEVDSDLDFSSTNNEFIPYFRGEIDFTGKTVSGTSQIRQGSSEWGMIGDFIEGKVMNLVYRPMDYIPIIADVNLSGLGTIGVELINITTDGDITITGMGNNDGLFINSAHYGSLKFTDCVNNANLYGSSYCGIFVGGYAESTVTSLEFVNCINNGNLVSKYAGLYYGNSAHVPQNVIITDCVNNGNIIGLAGGGSGLFCGHTSSNTATMNSFEEIANNGTTGNGIVRIETESMAISYDEKGTFTISSVPAETAKIEIVGSIYTRIMVGNTNRGTFMLSVKAIEDWEGPALDIEFPKYGVVDSRFTDFVSKEKDEYENTIVSDSSGAKYYQINAFELALPENAICIITNGSEDHKGTLSFTAYAYDVNGVPLAFSNV